MQVLTIDERATADIVRFWNSTIGDEYPMTIELFKQNTIKNNFLCKKSSKIVINQSNEIIALITAKKNPAGNCQILPTETGWIQSLMVDKEYREQGIGSHLLSLAEQHFKKDGIKKIFIGKDPYHYFPGVPKDYRQSADWFEKKGYTHDGIEHDLLNHYLNLKESQNIIEATADELSIALLSAQDKEAFLEFMEREFPGRWFFELKQYFKKGGTGREFLLLKEQDKIIGFSRINDSQSPEIAQNTYWSNLFEEELAGIGPLGIAADKRSMGYGLLIVEAAILTLRQRELNKIVIDWTTLTDFYGKLGFEVWKSYLSFSKIL